VSPFNDRKTLAQTTVDVDRLHNAKSGKDWILSQPHYCSVSKL